ncbi:hypothetical protein AB1L88_02625 [Tautonia sp. JC769]|uniref:hypothetical protein n=1 Tax=Tautonia sp. JC769 TaxID=3232135 RepID=UPI00345978D2
MSDTRRPRRSRRRRPAAAFDHLEPRRLLATLTVSNTDDDGPGSLREALEQANTSPGADEIRFDISGEGPHAITPTLPLPALDGPVILDGYTQPGARPNASEDGFDADIRIILDGGAISWGGGLLLGGSGSVVRGLAFHGFSGEAITVSGAENRIEGNIVGARVAPETEGNGYGIRIAGGDRNIIGGTTPEARNLISGNEGHGISIQYVMIGRFFFDDAEMNVVQGNLIGTDASGSGPLGNGGPGIQAYALGMGGNAIGGAEPGAANVIAFNGNAGVQGRALVSRNAIFENEWQGISHTYDPGPSQITDPVWEMSYPLLTEAEAVPEGFRVQGILLAEANLTFQLEFFADAGDPSGFGEGRMFLGTAEVSSNAEGHAIFNVVVPTAPPPGMVVTATASHPRFGTSEFSPNPAALATFANLVVTASVDAAEVQSGDEVTFAATVRNNGPGPATGTKVIVPLPNFRYSNLPADPAVVVSTSTTQGTVAIDGTNLIFDVGTLELEAEVSATVTVRVPPPSEESWYGPQWFEATFRAESDVFDLFRNDEATASVMVDPAELEREITVSPDQPRVGESVTIEYNVTNRGPAIARSVVVSSNLSYVMGIGLSSITTDRGTVQPDGSIELGDLPVGASATVTAIVRAEQPGPFEIHFWVRSPNIDLVDSTSVARFTVARDAGAAFITMSLPDLPRRAPRRVALAIGTDLEPARAADPGNYRLELVHPNGRARTVPLRSVSYDPNTWTVTLETHRPIPPGRTLRVTVRSGGLTTPDGAPIDGDGDFVPGGDFVGLISAGRTLHAREADGDRVALAMSHGLLELQRRPNGDALALRLVTVARRATLMGRVHRAVGGDGLATLPQLTFSGPAEVVHDRLPASFLRPLLG